MGKAHPQMAMPVGCSPISCFCTSMEMPSDVSTCCFFQVCQRIHCRATGIASWSSSESKCPDPDAQGLLPGRRERGGGTRAPVPALSTVDLAWGSEIQPTSTSRLSLGLRPGQPLCLVNPQLLNYQITALLILTRRSAADSTSDDLKPSNPLIAILNAVGVLR